MAMLITSDEDFLREMERLGLTKPESKEPEEVIVEENPSVIEDVIIEQSQAKIEQIQRGRPSGCLEIPSPIRQFIAEESLNGVPAKQLADSIGVSESSISAYKNGATSTATYNKPDDNLMNHVSKVKSAIAVKARGKLIAALESLTDDKISGAKAKDIAGIAKDMAAVVKHLEDKSDENKGPQVQFVFFAPKVKDESFFPVIEVND